MKTEESTAQVECSNLRLGLLLLHAGLLLHLLLNLVVFVPIMEPAVRDEAETIGWPAPTEFVLSLSRWGAAHVSLMSFGIVLVAVVDVGAFCLIKAKWGTHLASLWLLFVAAGLIVSGIAVLGTMWLPFARV